MGNVEPAFSLGPNGLNAGQHTKLAQILNAKAPSNPPSGVDQRRSPRYPYVLPEGLTLRIRHPGGSWAHDRVWPRTISAHGLGFFHAGYLHQHTYCIVGLPTRVGTVVVRDGRVVHCRHVLGRIHEIGVRLNVPLDVKPFLDHDLQASAEQHDPAARFTGRVLVAEAAPVERAMLRSEARALGVVVAEAGDAATTLARVREVAFDLIIAAAALPGSRPGELIAQLRDHGYQGPVVCWDASTGVAGGDWLTKPFAREQLVRLFDRHLSAARAAGEPALIESVLWSRPRLRPRLLAFLEQLEAHAVMLETLICQGSAGSRSAVGRRRLKIDAIVHQVHESAGLHGYPAIAAAAGALREQPLGEGHERLVAQCRAACDFRVTLEYPDAADWLAGPA